jgi:hypothetical protein
LRAGLTGCYFAKQFGRLKDRTAIEVFLDADALDVERLNKSLDEHASASRVGIAVFPWVRGTGDLVDLLSSLAANERWVLRRRSKRSPLGGALIGVEWSTRKKHISETMGFAPFSVMPVARRAPYVAVAVWPGARENRRRGVDSTPPGKGDEVSFLDASHEFGDQKYETMWLETSERVQRLMKAPPDQFGLYRRTAFVLPEADAAMLALS